MCHPLNSRAAATARKTGLVLLIAGCVSIALSVAFDAQWLQSSGVLMLGLSAFSSSRARRSR